MKKVIVLDPGHGGKDRSNRGPTTYVEADGNLQIANKIKSRLSKYKDVSIIMTRQHDVYLSLTDRGMMGAKADCFLSIHSNVASNTTVRGSEVFYSVDIPSDYEWAGMMSRLISSSFQVPNRGAKTRESLITPGEDYYTVMDVAQDNGAEHVLLLESLFHSNEQDELLLISEHGQNTIADCVEQTLVSMLKLELYTGDEVSSWAKDAQAWVIANGISDGTRPKDNVTREEVWTMLHRAHIMGTG